MIHDIEQSSQHTLRSRAGGEFLNGRAKRNEKSEMATLSLSSVNLVL
mgnify:FL=1